MSSTSHRRVGGVGEVPPPRVGQLASPRQASSTRLTRSVRSSLPIAIRALGRRGGQGRRARGSPSPATKAGRSARWVSLAGPLSRTSARTNPHPPTSSRTANHHLERDVFTCGEKRHGGSPTA